MYPKLQWVLENGKKQVKMDSGIVFECWEDRFFRFRCRGGDPRWIGSDFIGIDPGWGFFDPQLAGYVPLSVEFSDHPEEGTFIVAFRGKKANFPSRNDLTLIGRWMEEAQAFSYEMQMEFESDLEDLYQNSTRSMNGWKEHPDKPTMIEIVDFMTQYASLQDINQTQEADTPRPLYQWMVMSENGENWVKAPRIHINDEVAARNWQDSEGSLVYFPTQYGRVGSFFGFVDHEYGGWILRPLEVPSPIRYCICWYFYDVHMQSMEAIPPRGSQERVSLSFRCEFMPVDGETSRQIVSSAREYAWRDQERYDLPVMDYENHFDQSLVDMPGEETTHTRFWTPSDGNCRLDRMVGCEAPGSACIERNGAGAQPSAWYCVNWGIPYDEKQIIGRRFRMSAMVKCENVTGRARVGMVSRYVGGDIFYGYMTHYDDGEPRPVGGSMGGYSVEEGMRDMHWVFSDSVKGTQDWTKVSVEFDIYGILNNVFLEMYGDGKCWFDDVVIEDIGPALWKQVQCHPQMGLERFRENWAKREQAQRD